MTGCHRPQNQRFQVHHILSISHLGFSEYDLRFLRGISICVCQTGNFHFVTRRVKVFCSLAQSSKLLQNSSSGHGLGKIRNLRPIIVAWEMTSIRKLAAPIRITWIEVNFPEEVNGVLRQHTKQQMPHSRPMTHIFPSWSQKGLQTSQRALVTSLCHRGGSYVQRTGQQNQDQILDVLTVNLVNIDW